MGRPIDARDWRFEVEDVDAGTETWLPVENLLSWTVNPGENREVAATVDFDSAGYYEEDVMQVGATLSLTGQYSHEGGTRSPGQAYIDDVWAYRLGEDSRGRIRFRHVSQTNWTVWEATVTPGERGGETNAKTSWAASFTRCGRPTIAPVVNEA